MAGFFTWARETWKQRRREITAGALIVLVGLACFGWGYRVGASGDKTPIIIEVRKDV